MQNLLDTHLSVSGLKQITKPIDILNKEDFEKELGELISDRARADAIQSRLATSIKEKHDENPAYYDSFSKRIKAALEEYKDKVITEAEYLEKMRSIMEDYVNRVTDIKYPEKIKNSVHAQAFYGVVSAIMDDVLNLNANAELVADISLEITGIIQNHSMVDWSNNTTIHAKIAQDIDDMFYRHEKEGLLKLDFDTIDKIIENVKTVALRRF